MFDYLPYPKSKQLGKSQKEKDTPKYKEIRYPKKKKKNKKPYVSHGVQIPSRTKRSEFSITQRHQVIDLWGNVCRNCGSIDFQIHHRKFRSGLGRNNPRNGCPLCQTCHEHCHTDALFAQHWRDEAKAIWGEYYFWDKFDLWKHGMIERPTEELLERFFEGERERIEKGICEGKDGGNSRSG
jgi:ferredoxin